MTSFKKVRGLLLQAGPWEYTEKEEGGQPLRETVVSLSEHAGTIFCAISVTCVVPFSLASHPE